MAASQGNDINEQDAPGCTGPPEPGVDGKEERKREQRLFNLLATHDD